MGTCFRKPINSAAEIVPHNHIQPTTTTTTTNTTITTVRLYGGSPRITAYIQFALKYKAAAAVSLESEPGGDQFPVIEIGSERVSGPSKTLLQFIDSRFPHPPVFRNLSGDEEPPLTLVVVKELAELQHKSMTWHLERLVRWTTDLSTRQRKGRGGRRGDVRDPKVGTARMEVRKLGKSYSQLLEVMMEHAQMEERLLFPIFNLADPGICKAANEEHARDLPIMNGIKEDLKSIEVLDIGSPVYQEALSNFRKRLKSLQERCRQHFSEEEKQVLPYTEAAELSEKEQQRILDQCLDVMEESHSRLFNFLLEGLLPHEAMHYLDLISMCSNKERTTTMIQMTIS